jgi:hypothetical protein
VPRMLMPTRRTVVALAVIATGMAVVVLVM